MATAEYHRKWRAEHREQRLAESKKYYRENRDKELTRAKKWRQTEGYMQSQKKYIHSGKKNYAHLRHRYGLSEDKYDSLLMAQNMGCAVCGRIRKMVVDHDHSTGKVRGLVCYRCNIALIAMDDQELKKMLETYIGKHRE